MYQKWYNVNQARLKCPGSSRFQNVTRRTTLRTLPWHSVTAVPWRRTMITQKPVRFLLLLSVGALILSVLVTAGMAAAAF